jgi:hypothetical protein
VTERVVGVIRLPAAGPRMTLEVEIEEPLPPSRWRRRIAIWLIRCAGRLAKMRVRVVADQTAR